MHVKKWRYAAAVAAIFCCIASAALAEKLVAQVPVKGGAAEIIASRIEGENWLLLPSFASLETVSLLCDGEEVFFERACEGEAVALANANGERVSQTGVMCSENLRTVFLFSDDPVNAGRAYIEGDENHQTQTSGSLVMVDANGTAAHSAKITELSGRGNSTWQAPKKPYALQLDARMDLLDINQPCEKWVLLADAIDTSMIRNIMTLDLARELGIYSTPHAEHVDLYYDGEYRGTYLLCEKVEVDEWGIDELDYEELLEHLNSSVGIHDVKALPDAVGTNRYGAEFGYTSGIAEANLPSSGAYWIETDATARQGDNDWFMLPDGSKYVIQNPKNVSQNMAVYISERLAEARETLRYGGVHPVSGRSVEDDFDVDGFARIALLHELAFNPDGYQRSSFFVLPAGEARFETGPAWDFDLSWRYFTDLSNAGGRELEKMDGWLPDFYGVEAVWTRMGEIWEEELLPLIQQVLLGDEFGTHLRPIDDYAADIAASRRMNERLWEPYEFSRFLYGEDYEGEIELLKSYLGDRSAWLGEQLRTRKADPEKVDILVRAQFMKMNEQLEVAAYPWSRAEVTDFDCRQISEAAPDEYALWQLDAVIQPAPGHAFAAPEVTVNASPVPYQLQEDGCLKISVLIEDLSYRPADYYGEDYGMVFDADYYARMHPETAEECGHDPQLLLEYFCEEGMYEAHQGNAFFDPREVASKNPYLLEMLGEDWWLYYTEFISYGFDGGWLQDGKTFLPTVAAE